MTASALPGGIALAIWEIKTENTPDALQWLRGCFTWAIIPYFVIFQHTLSKYGFDSIYGRKY